MILLALILAPTFLALIAAHKIVAGVIVWVAFSSVVDGMPAPTDTSSVAYRWLHASLNVLAANAFRVACVLFPRFAELFNRG